MSNLHNVHDFKPFDAKTSKPFDGQRLAKAMYKKSKKGPADFSSICVSVPVVKASLTEKLLPILQERIEHAQDGIVREIHEKGISQVTTDQVNQDSCISFLLAELEGERLSKEDVASWFDSSVSETLQVLIADKLGVSNTPTDQETAKILAAVAEFKTAFSGLAGGRTQYGPQKAEKLLKVLEVTEVSDEIAVRFSARLNKMKQLAEDTLAAL